jgi:hypothetical protein
MSGQHPDQLKPLSRALKQRAKEEGFDPVGIARLPWKSPLTAADGSLTTLARSRLPSRYGLDGSAPPTRCIPTFRGGTKPVGRGIELLRF